MSGGLPDAKPWASCWPRSEATTTLTLLPVCLLHAAAALLTANVSAGPELPISAVSVTALLFAGEARAAPTVTASAPTVMTASATRQRAIRVLRCAFTNRFPPWESSRTRNEPADPSDQTCQARAWHLLSGSGRHFGLAISSFRCAQRGVRRPRRIGL